MHWFLTLLHIVYPFVRLPLALLFALLLLARLILQLIQIPISTALQITEASLVFQSSGNPMVGCY